MKKRTRTKTKWSWGDWKQAKIPAQVVGAVIEEHGKITAKELVALAHSPHSPLHAGFTWDNTVAAERFRQAEARSMLNHLVEIVVLPGRVQTPQPVRVLVAVPGTSIKGSGRQYMPISTAVTTHPKGWKQALKELRGEILSLRTRYTAWRQLEPYLEQLEKIVTVT